MAGRWSTIQNSGIDADAAVKTKTKVVKRSCNPVWNDELTLTIRDPEAPIHIAVYDKDSFSNDDNMGEADVDVKTYVECLRTGLNQNNIPNGTKLHCVQPMKHNCLANEISIVWENGKIVQDMVLKLRDVECGEVEIQIELVLLPGRKVIGSVEISSGAKVLHDLIRHTPNDLSSICPSKVHSCNLLSGRIGAVGSTIVCHITHDGKQQTVKEIIEEIDETNHKIALKVIGGEIVEEIYKAFKIIFHCEERDGKKWGVLTLEFERPNTSVPYPTSFMDYLCGVLKDMDNHASTK
ncbi:hypothetical protein L1987_79285 [Smallanthus sonchifolius]|uniref:Uncharacterized protein n=1 Tax=Smallanthus sonchifolius TaxID=185202 RepID=A0ACB8ZG20_9ASTR|nr:hypothetical protein L1987_79285 [Smallanthus sonchifolius]